MTFKDQLQRTLRLTKTPARIVSLVPSQTELLVDLGLASSIVGVTKFCVHPSYIKKQATVVGGTKTVRFDTIKALQPDIIICNKEENTKDIVRYCENIAPVWISDIATIEDNNAMISSFGKIFNCESIAQAMVTRINHNKEEFLKFVSDKNPKKVAYLIWKNPFMAAGKNTFIDYLLSLNNYTNIVAHMEGRYPEVRLQDLKNADVVLLSSEPFPFSDKHIAEIKKELQAEVLLVDGEYFSWYGSRIEQSFEYFKTLH